MSQRRAAARLGGGAREVRRLVQRFAADAAAAQTVDAQTALEAVVGTAVADAVERRMTAFDTGASLGE